MSRLLVSCGTLMPGGAERVLSVLSNGFADNYDEVIYLTWIDAPDFYPLDNRIKRICIERECNSKALIKKALWFRKYVKHSDFSLILSFLEPFNVLICGSLIGVDVPIIVADRNDPHWVWNNIFQRSLRFLAYRRARCIVCQTENNQNYYTGSYLRKTKVIYNPIFLPSEYKGRALKSPKEHRIVSVARLDEQKNLGMMIRAFALFHKNHKDYSLTIYGEGPMRERIETLISELELEGSVFLPGAKKNVWDLIVNAEIFALSSWYEGMPNALLEALCLGLPCVSTRVSGAKDLIEDGINGLLVDLGDEIGMAKCFEIIANDSQKGNRIGTEGANIFLLLRIDRISAEWINLFDKVLASKY